MGILDDISAWLGGTASDTSAPVDVGVGSPTDVGTSTGIGDVGANWPSLIQDTLDVGGAASAPAVTFPGGARITPTMGVVGAVGGMAMRGVAAISPLVASAIVKISQRLGGASGSIASYGARVWGQLSSWAKNNPGVSLVATLTSLGLTVEEAAHFLAWGATKKRRKRHRGISWRDLRTVRRTARRFSAMQHAMSSICTPARRHYAPRPRYAFQRHRRR